MVPSPGFQSRFFVLANENRAQDAGHAFYARAGIRKCAGIRALSQFAIVNQIQSPRFVVHDVVENVEGDDLRTVINIANGIDAQYIVAVLKEKLDSSHISKAEQEKLTILQLSEDDRLFEGKTVNARENSKGNILLLPFEF